MSIDNNPSCPFARRFADDLKIHGMSQRTIQSYCRALRKFIEFLSQAPEGPHPIMLARQDWDDRGNSSHTLRNVCSCYSSSERFELWKENSACFAFRFVSWLPQWTATKAA